MRVDTIKNIMLKFDCAKTMREVREYISGGLVSINGVLAETVDDEFMWYPGEEIKVGKKVYKLT